MNSQYESPIPTYLWRRQGDDFVFVETNRSGSDFGHGVWKQYVGRVASEIYREHPELLAAMQRVWDSGDSTGLEVEYTLSVTSRDAVLHVDIARIEPSHLALYVRDITKDREKDRRYRLVFEGASDGIIILSPKLEVEDVNDAARRMLALGPGPPPAGNLQDYLPEEDRADDPFRLDLAARPGGMVRERRLLRADGSVMDVEVNACKLEDGRFVVFMRDTTIRYQRDTALRTSEEQYRRMIELSPDAVVVHSAGRIVYANEAAVHMVRESSRENMIGKSALHYLHPDCVADVSGRIRVLTEEQRDVPLVVEKFVRADGVVIDVEVAGLALEYGGRPSVQVIARDISERVRQQDALRKSEERYRGLVDAASEAIYRIGFDGRILAVNPAITKITGWSEEELLRKDFASFLHPADRDLAAEVLTAAGEGRAVTAVIRVLTRDGGIAYLDTTTTTELVDGKPTVMFGRARDITEARRAAAELEEREKLLATVLDQLPVGVVIADETGRVVRSNPVADEIWHRHRSHIAIATKEVFRGWWSDSGRPLSPEDWASSRALRKGETVLDEIIDIEGSDGVRKTILNSAVPLRDAEGAIRGVLILNQDVTERRALAKQRESLAARLRQVISSTSEGICTVDTSGSVTLMNPAAASMLGWAADEVIGRNLHTLVHPSERHGESDPFLAVIEAGAPKPLFEDRFADRSRRAFEVEVSCAPIVAEGSLLGAVVAFRDVTTRNALERQLERTSRLSSLGQLAATIAHEFNNVMMGIMPFMEVIIRRADSDPSLRSMAEHIRRALARGKQITSQILRFAQTSAPDLRPVEVQAFFETVASELRAIAGGAVDLRIAPVESSLAIAIDAGQMHQVLINLVSNARDAMGHHGTIEIEARAAADDETRTFPAQRGGYVRISVRDHGVGMDALTMERMFEPLFTTKRSGGTGLGLAFVQQVVAAHHGFIAAESDTRRGTEFRLYLPASVAKGTAPAPAPARSVLPARRVLIVEDDESVSAGLAAVLEAHGSVTRVVAKGLEALGAAREFDPDAVILDRGLPDTDGIDVCIALLAQWPGLPIVFSTGHGDRGDLAQMSDLPNVGYLIKPYEIETLIDVLNEVMGVKA